MKTCVALGFFDGVHIGHRELVKKTVAEAKTRDAKAVVYTFFAHPSHILTPDTPVKCICSSAQKAEVFSSLGIDEVVFDDFEEVRNLSPFDFVQDILITRLGAECVICGYNFRFGRGNVGDIDTLSSILSTFGKKLYVIPPVCANDEPVSSGRIRTLLEKGDVKTANILLSHPYYLEDEVVHGKHIGHCLGFPTANLEFFQNAVVLAHGVYYTKTVYKSREYLSVTNVGTRPTVNDGKSVAVCETHIIDFNDEFYGEKIKVSFYDFARPEIRFESLDALSRALQNDVEACRKFFEKVDKK